MVGIFLIGLAAAAPEIVGMPLPETPQWLERPTRADYEAARPTEGPANGAKGAATVLCAVTAEGRLSPCRSEEEMPAGMGFGPAALSLTAKFRMKTELTTGEPVAGHWIQLRLRFPPILPPPPNGARLIENPQWLRRPDGQEFAKYYPDRAQRMMVAGHALVECSVTSEGSLSSCILLDEDPTEFGFGDAAIRLMPLFRMKPLDADGLPVAGGVARVTINFSPG